MKIRLKAVLVVAGVYWANLACAALEPSYRNVAFCAAGLGSDFGVIERNGDFDIWSPFSAEVRNSELMIFDLGFGHVTVVYKDGGVETFPVLSEVGRTQPKGLHGVVSVGCGDGYTIAIISSGEIAVWGERGSPVVEAYNAKKADLAGKKFRSLSAGAFHVLLLGEDGEVTALGSNRHGECDIPGGNRPVRKLAAGDICSLVLYEDGTIQAFGSNNRGQLDIPKVEEGYVDVSAGRDHCLAVTEKGELVGWGTPLSGDGVHNPAQVPNELQRVRFTSVIAKGTKSFALAKEGDLYMWGSLLVKRRAAMK